LRYIPGMPLAVPRDLERRLSPYGRYLLARCGECASSLHADEAGPEHLLSTLMDDEACAAHRAVLQAFADPESISGEARALSAGIMVTGSAASLAFSVRGVRALERARELASSHRPEVTPAHLLLACVGELEDDLRVAIDAAGFEPAALEPLLGPSDDAPWPDGGPLFRRFSEDSKRALSAAARVARQACDAAISPAHVLLAVLQSEAELARAGGISASRARLLLRGRTADPTRPPPREIPADEALEGFLAGLPEGASSLAMLRGFHAGGTPELAQILSRHRMSAALLERAQAGFEDPDPPGAASTESQAAPAEPRRGLESDL
jgi:ATP-dependent Clp protease ATP-binding subunit ClpA